MKEQSSSGNERSLAGEFHIVDGEFSDLRCLMNTLVAGGFSGNFEW